MGRPRKEEAAEKKRKAEILAAPPEPARDWTPIVEARTTDPQKREALLQELAKLDELERACRPGALRGIASAARLLLDVGKQRARLLGLTSAELGEKDPDDLEGEVDRVQWSNADGDLDDLDADDGLDEMGDG